LDFGESLAFISLLRGAFQVGSPFKPANKTLHRLVGCPEAVLLHQMLIDASCTEAHLDLRSNYLSQRFAVTPAPGTDAGNRHGWFSIRSVLRFGDRNVGIPQPQIPTHRFPEPKPKPDEALIGVEAFSLNHGELPKLGFFPEGTTGGWDSAGRVIQPAADGSGPQAGTRVVGFAVDSKVSRDMQIALKEPPTQTVRRD
jgi:hypothetical protein